MPTINCMHAKVGAEKSNLKTPAKAVDKNPTVV
jgi:hypothetical protein